MEIMIVGAVIAGMLITSLIHSRPSKKDSGIANVLFWLAILLWICYTGFVWAVRG